MKTNLINTVPTQISDNSVSSKEVSLFQAEHQDLVIVGGKDGEETVTHEFISENEDQKLSKKTSNSVVHNTISQN